MIESRQQLDLILPACEGRSEGHVRTESNLLTVCQCIENFRELFYWLQPTFTAPSEDSAFLMLRGSRKGQAAFIKKQFQQHI